MLETPFSCLRVRLLIVVEGSTQSPDDICQSVLPTFPSPLDGDLSGPKRLSALQEELRCYRPVSDLATDKEQIRAKTHTSVKGQTRLSLATLHVCGER